MMAGGRGGCTNRDRTHLKYGSRLGSDQRFAENSGSNCRFENTGADAGSALLFPARATPGAVMPLEAVSAALHLVAEVPRTGRFPTRSPGRFSARPRETWR